MGEDSRTMTVTRHDDGSVTVDGFPDQMPVTPEFLRYVDQRFVYRVGFRSFAIRVSNGEAVYRIVGRYKWRDVLLCVRMS